MRYRLTSSVMVFALVSALGVSVNGCSSKEPRPSPSGSGGKGGASVRPEGGEAAAGEASRSGAGGAGDGGAGDGGAGDDAGGASTGGIGGAAGDAAQGGEPAAPEGPFTGPDPFPCDSDMDAAPGELEADCAPGGVWGAGSAVPSSAGAGASLVGVTPDELTLVWSEASGSERLYFVADRASVNEAFGAPRELGDMSVLAVSPDGLRLAVLSLDHSALVALTRVDRASDFGSEAEGEFSALDADARDKGWSFSSGVFSPDDRTLFYTVGAADSKYLLHVARRADAGPWGVGTLLEQCELEVHGGYGRYPTGVSADGKTLFFFDSWRGVTRAAWRAAETSAFTWFKDLGRLSGAQPNASCDRLYFSVSGEESTILSAAAE